VVGIPSIVLDFKKEGVGSDSSQYSGKELYG